MKQEDKELLLRYLCMALPYGVKVQDELGRVNKLVIGNADLIRLYYNDFSIYGENALSLPLLRPMSSMTEEEYNELKVLSRGCDCVLHFYAWFPAKYNAKFKTYNLEVIDWLLAHHFDYRGLIPKGLAIAITEKK